MDVFREFSIVIVFPVTVVADEPSEISTTSTGATTVVMDVEEGPMEEIPKPTVETRGPEFIRPLVTAMELPEGGIAK